MRISDTLHLLHLPSWLNDGVGVLTATFLHTIEDFIKLKEYCLKTGLNKIYQVPISEDIIDQVKKLAKITYDDSNAEYVYSINDLVQKKGKQYQEYRHKINRFKNLYPDVNFIKSDKPPSTKIIKEIKNLYEIWHDFSTESSEHSSNEQAALDRYIKISSQKIAFFGKTVNFYLYNSGTLVAFATVELVNDKYAVGHFLKINLNLSGSSQYFIYSICKELKKMGVITLNAQEDMGIEGLKNFKKHLNPQRMSHAYDLVIG